MDDKVFLRLKELGKKLSIHVKKEKGFVAIKPKISLTKSGDIDLFLWMFLSICLVSLIIRVWELDLVLTIMLVIVVVPGLLSLLTIIGILYSGLKIYPDKIEFVDLFKKKTISLKSSMSLHIDYTSGTKKIKYISRRFVSVDLTVKTKADEHRFFHKTTNAADTIAIKGFANLIVEEIKSRSKKLSC